MQFRKLTICDVTKGMVNSPSFAVRYYRGAEPAT